MHFYFCSCACAVDDQLAGKMSLEDLSAFRQRHHNRILRLLVVTSPPWGCTDEAHDIALRKDQRMDFAKNKADIARLSHQGLTLALHLSVRAASAWISALQAYGFRFVRRPVTIVSSRAAGYEPTWVSLPLRTSGICPRVVLLWLCPVD